MIVSRIHTLSVLSVCEAPQNERWTRFNQDDFSLWHAMFNKPSWEYRSCQATAGTERSLSRSVTYRGYQAGLDSGLLQGNMRDPCSIHHLRDLPSPQCLQEFRTAGLWKGFPWVCRSGDCLRRGIWSNQCHLSVCMGKTDKMINSEFPLSCALPSCHLLPCYECHAVVAGPG